MEENRADITGRRNCVVKIKKKKTELINGKEKHILITEMIKMINVDGDRPCFVCTLFQAYQ